MFERCPFGVCRIDLAIVRDEFILPGSALTIASIGQSSAYLQFGSVFSVNTLGLGIVFLHTVMLLSLQLQPIS